MKRIIAGLLVILSVGCASWQKDTKTVLDVATEACVLEHMFWQNAQIESFCGVTKELIPAVEALLDQQRKEAGLYMTKDGAGYCK